MESFRSRLFDAPLCDNYNICDNYDICDNSDTCAEIEFNHLVLVLLRNPPRAITPKRAMLNEITDTCDHSGFMVCAPCAIPVTPIRAILNKSTAALLILKVLCCVSYGIRVRFTCGTVSYRYQFAFQLSSWLMCFPLVFTGIFCSK